MLFKDVPLRATGALLLYIAYGDSALLVLNRTSLNSVNTLLAVSRPYVCVKCLSKMGGGTGVGRGGGGGG